MTASQMASSDDKETTNLYKLKSERHSIIAENYTILTTIVTVTEHYITKAKTTNLESYGDTFKILESILTTMNSEESNLNSRISLQQLKSIIKSFISLRQHNP
jgi:cell division protein ZapA (FtsZ GTPase activity inhibitor)